MALDSAPAPLHGTLTMPDGAGSVDGISRRWRVRPGRSRRQHSGAIKNRLKLLAHDLASGGIASLRIDKRGIAASRDAGPSEKDLRFATYVDDAVGWVGVLAALFRPSVQPYVISWLTLDPVAELAKTAMPALVIRGSTYLQVTAEDARLLAGARPDIALLAISGMNHVLKSAPEERAANLGVYADPDRELGPGSVSLISNRIPPSAALPAVSETAPPGDVNLIAFDKRLKNLAQLGLVGTQAGKPRRDVSGEPELPLLGAQQDEVVAGLDYLADVDISLGQHQRAGPAAPEVENVGDEIEQVPAASMHKPGIVAISRIAERPIELVAHHLGEAEYGGEQRAHLMAEMGEHGPFLAGVGFELAARRAQRFAKREIGDLQLHGPDDLAARIARGDANHRQIGQHKKAEDDEIGVRVDQAGYGSGRPAVSR